MPRELTVIHTPNMEMISFNLDKVYLVDEAGDNLATDAGAPGTTNAQHLAAKSAVKTRDTSFMTAWMDDE